MERVLLLHFIPISIELERQTAAQLEDLPEQLHLHRMHHLILLPHYFSPFKSDYFGSSGGSTEIVE